MPNERGATVCMFPDGRMVLGPEQRGDSRTHVTVKLLCPGGTRPVGLTHTHPGGDSTPSSQDVRETRRLNLHFICASSPETGRTGCVVLRPLG